MKKLYAFSMLATQWNYDSNAIQSQLGVGWALCDTSAEAERCAWDECHESFPSTKGWQHWYIELIHIPGILMQVAEQETVND